LKKTEFGGEEQDIKIKNINYGNSVDEKAKQTKYSMPQF
jgi:hypothetical protein